MRNKNEDRVTVTYRSADGNRTGQVMALQVTRYLGAVDKLRDSGRLISVRRQRG